MSNCIEIDEEDKFPLDIKVKFNFSDKFELEYFIRDLDNIIRPMNGIYELIDILKSKL